MSNPLGPKPYAVYVPPKKPGSDTHVKVMPQVGDGDTEYKPGAGHDIAVLTDANGLRYGKPMWDKQNGADKYLTVPVIDKDGKVTNHVRFGPDTEEVRQGEDVYVSNPRGGWTLKPKPVKPNLPIPVGVKPPGGGTP